MLIGVPAETTAGETRVAVTPETAKKIIAQGHQVLVQSGAGVAAIVTDAAFEAVGVQITDAASALGAEVILTGTRDNRLETGKKLGASHVINVTKENAVEVLMKVNKQEKTSLNKQVWNDYVFNQHNYWKEITQDEKKIFGELRAKSFEEINALFINTIKGSPKPRAVLKKEFEAAIIDRLSKEPFQKTTSDFMEGLLTKDLNILAAVIGKLDFIKSIQQPKGETNAGQINNTTRNRRSSL